MGEFLKMRKDYFTFILILLAAFMFSIAGKEPDDAVRIEGFIAAVVTLILILFRNFLVNGCKLDKFILISLLAALAALSKIIFSPISFLYLDLFIIILAGMIFGFPSAFFAGLIAGIVTSFFIKENFLPQIIAYSVVGIFSGACGKSFRVNKIDRIYFVIMSVILFSYVKNFGCVWNIFDLIGGVINSLLLLFTGDFFIKKFDAIEL